VTTVRNAENALSHSKVRIPIKEALFRLLLSDNFVRFDRGNEGKNLFVKSIENQIGNGYARETNDIQDMNTHIVFVYVCTYIYMYMNNDNVGLQTRLHQSTHYGRAHMFSCI